MRLIDLELTRFCQHASATFQFSPGLNCIRGPNGSGKSNLLAAVAGAVTNDFPKDSGGRDANATVGTDGPAGVKLRFEHHGTLVEIERGFRPSSHRLQIGGKTFHKEADVRRELSAFLAVADVVLRDFVFVRQGELAAFLTASASHRADAFHELFGLTKAEAIWTAIKEADTTVPAPSVDVAAVRARLKNNYAKLAEVVAEAATAGAVPADVAVQIAHLQQRIAEHAQAVSAANTLTSLEAEAARWAGVRTEAEAQAEGLASRLARHRADMAARQARVDAAKLVRDQWQAFDAATQARAAAEKAVTTLEADMQRLADPQLPTDYVADTSEIVAAMSAMTAEKGRLEMYASTFDPASGRAECPTCGTPASALPTDPVEAANRAKALADDLRLLNAAWARSRQYDTLLRVRGADRAQVTAKLEAALTTLAGLSVPTPPTTPVGEYDAAVAAVSAASLDLQIVAESLAAAQTKAATAQAKEAKCLADIARVREMSGVMTAAELTAAEKEVVRLSEMARRATARAVTRATLEKEIESDEALLKWAAPMAEKVERAGKLTAHLTRVREVFHRTALPAVVAKRRLRELEQRLNDMLRRFGSDFTVFTDDTLQFVANTRLGPQPMGRLSWGQRAVLALAFRVVVNAQYAGDLGLLCLDEPTAWLDERNIRCVETALTALRDVSANSGLQLLFITHERSLDHLFDKVIELSPS